MARDDSRQRSGRIIAIGGGKGGVGKTLVSAHLAIGLAQRGHRVMLVDADLGGANLHTALGMAPPLTTLSDFLTQQARLEDVAVDTPFPRLRLVSGALDDMEAANPLHQQKMRLLRHLSTIDADYLILDLGAGTSFNTLDFFLVASCGVLVVLPEPPSVENAYRFLKAAYFRRLAVVEKAYGIKELVDAARAQRGQLGIRTPADLIRAVTQRSPEIGLQVQRQMARFVPRLVVNQVRTREDEDVGRDMASACRRFLGIRLDVLGTVPDDDAVRRAVKMRKPLWLTETSSPARRALDALTDRLLSMHTVTDRAA